VCVGERECVSVCESVCVREIECVSVCVSESESVRECVCWELKVPGRGVTQ